MGEMIVGRDIVVISSLDSQSGGSTGFAVWKCWVEVMVSAGWKSGENEQVRISVA